MLYWGIGRHIGTAEVVRIVSARPEQMSADDLAQCGFPSLDAALAFVRRVHADEYDRDGVFTVFHFRVVERRAHSA